MPETKVNNCIWAYYYKWLQGRIQGFRKGGGAKKVEVTVHVVVPSTGRRPVDATPWASPGGGLEGGFPPLRN